VHNDGNSESDSEKKLSVPFSYYYGQLLRSFFKTKRCLTCIDHYGEIADVCFGDIHVPPYDKDIIGISSWIARSEYWEQLFHKAVDDGYIHMDDLGVDTLNASQKAMLYPKKRKAQAVMNLNNLIARANPIYNKELENPNIKDYISVLVCLCQMFIGRHKQLWWIIDLINKGK
jgi:coenzyme F420 hydrogenase subunit beta